VYLKSKMICVVIKITRILGHFFQLHPIQKWLADDAESGVCRPGTKHRREGLAQYLNGDVPLTNPVPPYGFGERLSIGDPGSEWLGKGDRPQDATNLNAGGRR
jgi:hypothetical protein